MTATQTTALKFLRRNGSATYEQLKTVIDARNVRRTMAKFVTDGIAVEDGKDNWKVADTAADTAAADIDDLTGQRPFVHLYLVTNPHDRLSGVDRKSVFEAVTGCTPDAEFLTGRDGDGKVSDLIDLLIASGDKAVDDGARVIREAVLRAKKNVTSLLHDDVTISRKHGALCIGYGSRKCTVRASADGFIARDVSTESDPYAIGRFDDLEDIIAGVIGHLDAPAKADAPAGTDEVLALVTIANLNEMEMGNGVAYTLDLMFGGDLIATVENSGRGGCDLHRIKKGKRATFDAIMGAAADKIGGIEPLDRILAAIPSGGKNGLEAAISILAKQEADAADDTPPSPGELLGVSFDDDAMQRASVEAAEAAVEAGFDDDAVQRAAVEAAETIADSASIAATTAARKARKTRKKAPTGGEGAGGVSEGDRGEVRAVQADPEVEALKASMGVEGDVVIEPAGKPVSEWPSMLVFKYGRYYLEQLALGPVQPDDLMARCCDHFGCKGGTAKTKLNVLRGAKWAHRENRKAPLVLTDAGLRALNYARKNDNAPNKGKSGRSSTRKAKRLNKGDRMTKVGIILDSFAEGAVDGNVLIPEAEIARIKAILNDGVDPSASAE